MKSTRLAVQPGRIFFRFSILFWAVRSRALRTEFAFIMQFAQFWFEFLCKITSWLFPECVVLYLCQGEGLKQNLGATCSPAGQGSYEPRRGSLKADSWAEKKCKKPLDKLKTLWYNKATNKGLPHMVAL